MVRLALLTILLTFGSLARGTSCESDVLQTAFTPRLDYWWSPTVFRVTETVEQFLSSGSAKVMAARGKGSSIPDQLRLVVGHVREHVDYQQNCALEPPRTFADVLARGQGACIQINLLAAGVLARAGFRAQIAYREPAAGWGHLWIEVGEGDRAFVLDATREGYVTSLESIRRGKPSADAFESQWYLHKDRRLRGVQ